MDIHPRRLSFAFLSSFLITVFVLQWWQLHLYPLALWGGLGLMCIADIVGINEKKIVTFATTLGVAVAFLSVMRTTHVPTVHSIDSYADKQEVRVTGVIAGEPDRRPMHTKYTIKAEEVEITGSGRTIAGINGKVLVSDHANWPRYSLGDHVEVTGLLERPQPIEDFHYDKYLSRYGIHAVIYRGSVHLSGTQTLSFHTQAQRSLYRLKEGFELRINRLFPEPHASFMAGLLTGSRKGIPDDLTEVFNITGLTHIIAISGYNITIIITIISGALFWLPFRWRLVPAMLAIALFTLFVGAGAAVVRAAIMGILGLIALHSQRKTEIRLTLLWTLFFMLAWNPKYLWYDAGFQLSFLAVIGLAEIGPKIEHWFAKLPEYLGIRESMQMTIAAQLSAVPLIILLFGRLSLVAPFANLLTAPFIPVAMLFGFLGTIVSMMWFPLGQLFAYAAWACMEWIIRIAQLLSSVPYAAVDIAYVTPLLFLLYYIALIAWLSPDVRQNVLRPILFPRKRNIFLWLAMRKSKRV